MIQHYSGDPRWINAKYPGKCRDCGATIPRGADAYYYPRSKSIYCSDCGEQHHRDFMAAAQDEAMMSGQY